MQTVSLHICAYRSQQSSVCDAWGQIPRLAHTVVGHGKTQLQALQSRVIAGAVLGYRELTARQSTGRLVLLPVAEIHNKLPADGLNQASAFYWLGTGDVNYTLPQKLGFQTATWTKRYTKQPKVSFLSTGNIFSDDFKIPKRSMAEKLR